MTDARLTEPVLVLGVDTSIGLAVVRDLGRHGVTVHAIGSDRKSLGLASRYCATSNLIPKDELLQVWLPALARRRSTRLVMTISESDIIALNACRSAMPELRLLIPDADKMAMVLDKRRTLDAARAVGISIPRTWEITDLGELAQLREDLSWPVVLKWPDPNAVASKLENAGLQLQKKIYAGSLEELSSVLQSYEPIGVFPLIQEYIGGVGIGHSFMMANGRPVLSFQHRRVHEWPPGGGVSSCAVEVSASDDREAVIRSVRLLERIGWEGPAMVEYRFDPKSRRTVLMEVNGRFWGSLPLAIACNANFPWFTYCWLGLGVIPPSAPQKTGLKARSMIPETKRLIRVLFNPRATQNPLYRNTPLSDLLAYFTGFFDPRMRYYLWSWDDPWPFCRDIISVAEIASAQLLSRIRNSSRAASMRLKHVSK